MSNEDRLPNELADVQTRLTALAPKPSRIDRDELMYRAGFAAARAKMSRRGWVLPTLSAAAATVIAVAVMQQLPSKSESAPSNGQLFSQTAVPEVIATVKDESVEKRTATVRPAYRFDFSNAPLLATRERALQFEFDELTPEVASDAKITVGPTASVQQLREEFLLQRRNPAILNDGFPWQWLQPWTRKGENT